MVHDGFMEGKEMGQLIPVPQPFSCEKCRTRLPAGATVCDACDSIYIYRNGTPYRRDQSGTELVIKSIIERLLIPGVLLGFFALALLLTFSGKPDPTVRIPKYLAFGLGIVIFLIIYGLYKAGAMTQPTQALSSIPAATWVAGIIWFIVAIILLALIKPLLLTGTNAFLITLLSCGSTTTLYFYSTGRSRTPILVGSLAFLAGALIYLIFISPDTLQAILHLNLQR